MRKLVVVLCFVGALAIVQPGFGNMPPQNPPPPPPNCPEGYTKDAASTATAVLCTRTNTIVKHVPGPTVYVDVPGPTVEKIVTVEVPVDRVVVKYKIKRVVQWHTKYIHKLKRVVRWHTRVIYVHCPVPGNG